MSQKRIVDAETLELMGLRENDMTVYRALLQLGSAPLRRIADESGLHRGTTYDVLKRLMSHGLVSYVDARSHRYFTAEDPRKLTGLLTRREVALQEARQSVEQVIPGLMELTYAQKHRPVVRYYEGRTGVKDVLKDILEVTEKSSEKLYRVYSSAGIRDFILSSWPQFSAARKKRKVKVRAIAIGEGGRTVGLDERRWLKHKAQAPTYIFIYGDKTAHVGLDEASRPFCVVMEGGAMAKTQGIIFDALWESLA